MELQEKIKDIKTQFRLAMNGVVAQRMREQGLNYKMNFGVELPRLKEIATHYEKDHELAQALWKENVRESKILAGMLQPVDSFYPEIADIWVEDMVYPEIAEITCMTLFQYLPYAPAKAFEWIADEREFFQMCGFLLAARLFSKGLQLNERAEAEFLDQAQTSILSESLYPRKAAILALKKYGMQGKDNAKKVHKLIVEFKRSEKEELEALYEDIRLEIEYLL